MESFRRNKRVTRWISWFSVGKMAFCKRFFFLEFSIFIVVEVFLGRGEKRKFTIVFYW